MELTQGTRDKGQGTTGAANGGLRLSDFDYLLPKERIAQHPLSRRDRSRLLVLHRDGGRIEHRLFRDLPDYLNPPDLLVLNDTKVISARLLGKRSTGGKVEVLLLNRIAPQTYEALLNPSAKLETGSPLFFEDGSSARLIGGNGTVKTIRFETHSVETWMRRTGLVPLPPYIRRHPNRTDRNRYQTVYARREGAVAAPTAGLHFTRSLLQKIKERGIGIASVTLHVGYGTFEPVREEEIARHKMHEESFELPQRTASLLNETRRLGGRVIAVGTTSCRVLETSIRPRGFRVTPRQTGFRPRKGWTNLFIYPPYAFRGTDALVTNFHLPKSTLLMLVSAFAGMDLIRKAYREAIERGYRFYSYGDAMLIL